MKMKKYMIRCDMEGVSGIVSYEQAEPGRGEYAVGQRMFMSDLLAVVEGLQAGGADEIAIYDEHFYGRNIDLDRLPAGVTAICGKPPYRANWAGGLDKSFSGLVLLGLHSKADTAGGLLPHSYELDIADLRLNGLSVGEIGMEAAIAGDHGVPAVLIVGDSAGVKEAQALLPGIAGVAVKQSLCETGALCHPLAVTSQWIRRAAAQVANRPPAVKPYRVGAKVTLEVQLRHNSYLNTARRLYARDMTSDDTLVLKGRSATAVWADYWQRKIRCQESF
jgi:D-amino peptidase